MMLAVGVVNVQCLVVLVIVFIFRVVFILAAAGYHRVRPEDSVVKGGLGPEQAVA